MEDAAALVAGRHDFTAFTPAETEHVFFNQLVLRSAWKQERRELLRFEIEAEAFLRHMVRVLVGTMVEIGRGERTLEDFSRLLKGAERPAAGQTAPARGLFLWDIRYGRVRAASKSQTVDDALTPAPYLPYHTRSRFKEAL
jgi:tRNA pseudouridine38-40 synthase